MSDHTGEDGGSEDQESQDHQQDERPDWLEKSATIIAGLMLLAILAVLVWDGVHADRPPDVSAVSGGAGDVRGESRYVPVMVENAGDEAVRDVHIGVEATLNGTRIEGEFELDWLPGHSKREGVAVLPKATVGQPVKATVKGYVMP